jgi:hypothetical protein
MGNRNLVACLAATVVRGDDAEEQITVIHCGKAILERRLV